ncbi:hypothetical protein WG926_11130 [Tistrella sp. BH-R2-4]|uniref:Uncharacterized protein n=2 Tax=Geminicoccaceae TaxID=2066434 RepID=A0ABU9YJ94_9PROT
MIKSVTLAATIVAALLPQMPAMASRQCADPMRITDVLAPTTTVRVAGATDSERITREDLLAAAIDLFIIKVDDDYVTVSPDGRNYLEIPRADVQLSQNVRQIDASAPQRSTGSQGLGLCNTGGAK